MTDATKALFGDAPRQDEIDRGEAPATTVRQLVSALRQNIAGAGADLLTVELALQQGNEAAANDALKRLERHIAVMSAKATLAIEAAGRD